MLLVLIHVSILQLHKKVFSSMAQGLGIINYDAIYYSSVQGETGILYIYCPVWRETWRFVQPRQFMSPEGEARGRHELSGLNKSSSLPTKWAINFLLHRKLNEHLCIGECPSIAPFLENNGPRPRKGPRSIVFKEWNDTRTFAYIKSTHRLQPLPQYM